MADDHRLVREGLRMLLELEKDLQIVGEAEDGRQAVALVKKLRHTSPTPGIAVFFCFRPGHGQLMLHGLQVKPPRGDIPIG